MPTSPSSSQAPTDEPDAPVEPEEPPPPTYRPALDRDLSPDLDVAALARSAELTLERRIPGVGLDELLDLASAYRRDGRADAALDTCYLALSLAPDDVGIHLALVELYDERGWQSLAGEKLDLLDRLTGLDADPDRAARVAAARGRARLTGTDPPARSSGVPERGGPGARLAGRCSRSSSRSSDRSR